MEKNDKNYMERIKAWPGQLVKLVTTRQFWTDLVIMTVGMFIAACAVHFFLVPSKLVVGSITGLSMVIYKLVPWVTLGTYIFVINAILLVLSFILIGSEFGAKTVYTALILGPMVDFLDWVAPIKESLFTQYVAGQAVTQPWFDIMCFILILAMSQSFLFSINASTGGLDILAKIINKYAHINLGTSVTIGGGLICATAFSINDVSLVIMGLIATWMDGVILNYFMGALHSRDRIYIITDDYEKIQNYVLHTLNRGVTLSQVVGGYTGVKRMQLEIVLSHDDLDKLKAFMEREHIDSFSTIDSVAEVRGLWNTRNQILHHNV